MTREPFIAHSELTNEIYIVTNKEKYRVTEQAIKAVKAIKALEQEYCIQEKQANADNIDAVYIDGFKAGYSQARFDLEQEPCEDCISRQAVLDCLTATGLKKYDFILNARDKIKNLPSVKPQEPKTGHWIEVIDEIDNLGNKTWHHKCSICGNEDSGWGNYKYCPNCGARMESEEV